MRFQPIKVRVNEIDDFNEKIKKNFDEVYDKHNKKVREENSFSIIIFAIKEEKKNRQVLFRVAN